jgi:hypothetical protein
MQTVLCSLIVVGFFITFQCPMDWYPFSKQGMTQKAAPFERFIKKDRFVRLDL